MTKAIHKDSLRDFTTDSRVLVLAAMALVIGTSGAGAAWVLLQADRAVHQPRLFRAVLDRNRFPSAHRRSASTTIAVPVIGSLIVGLMARYGSEKIRGHGIPEAIEAILIGQSRIEPKVALLKPLSSAISIGTGGPFGAEGPIIMTGGALGSLFAQLFHLSSAERKTLLVAGAAAGMTAVFGTPIAAVLLAVELLLFEWKPRSFIPVAVAAIVAACLAAVSARRGAAVSLCGRARSFRGGGLGLCALVGVVAGLQSALMTIVPLWRRRSVPQTCRSTGCGGRRIGGLVVGIGGYIDPAVLGVGYDNIRALLHGSLNLHDASAAADRQGA